MVDVGISCLVAVGSHALGHDRAHAVQQLAGGVLQPMRLVHHHGAPRDLRELGG